MENVQLLLNGMEHMICRMVFSCMHVHKSSGYPRLVKEF